MHAVIVDHEILNGLLETIDVDEGEKEDWVGAVGELSDSWVEKDGTFEIVSNGDGRQFFAVERTGPFFEVLGLSKNIW